MNFLKKHIHIMIVSVACFSPQVLIGTDYGFNVKPMFEIVEGFGMMVVHAGTAILGAKIGNFIGGEAAEQLGMGIGIVAPATVSVISSRLSHYHELKSKQKDLIEKLASSDARIKALKANTEFVKKENKQISDEDRELLNAVNRVKIFDYAMTSLNFKVDQQTAKVEKEREELNNLTAMRNKLAQEISKVNHVFPEHAKLLAAVKQIA